MDYRNHLALERFKENIGIPFQLYNSLFISLPFHKIEKTGILLSLFLDECIEGYKAGYSPDEIIGHFFNKHTSAKTEKDRLDLMFRFIQYAERQVVLFDALEDAGFKKVNQVDGQGSLQQLASDVSARQAEERLKQKLNDFAVRIVLTAHPTQFYPGSVLGIIRDLSDALRDNRATDVNEYLQQLGKTAFFNKEKPSPLDEAKSLIWYLEHVFYKAVGNIMHFIDGEFGPFNRANALIALGFWPGGDRDGNPNVNASITLEVARQLKMAILRCYASDIENLRKRLTFKGLEKPLAEISYLLEGELKAQAGEERLNSENLLLRLNEVREIVLNEHSGLFSDQVDDLISKIKSFGFHFATLDIRQESSIHTAALAELANANGFEEKYQSLDGKQRIQFLLDVNRSNVSKFPDESAADCIESLRAMKSIQKENGEAGCCRYIISQCNSALNVIEVYGLALLAGWKKNEMKLDIVPLFETVDDLEHAPGIMEELFAIPGYRDHILRRGNTQTIMVGFSDGTKDGGYLMANWAIYQAKKSLTETGKRFGIDIIFFDGRGGPPSRGGGKTHKFYASMGPEISNKEIQLTIQGQTISSGFGTNISAQFNLEQLFTAGLNNTVFPNLQNALSPETAALFEFISQKSLEKYRQLRNHPDLISYLLEATPIQYYSETNIASRPASRRAANEFTLKDIRAIPYVGAWSQVKQNITGYYGVGTAMKALEENGKFEELARLYNKSTFLKTLFDNCEMSMHKCFFPLTAYLSKESKFANLWKDIYEEFILTRNYVLRLSGNQELMEDYPVEQLSISMREKIVLPITTIQQYGLKRLREETDTEARKDFEKLVIRCSFGIINAARNAV
jgi:phosphoenolpyruvate carboxylase